MTRHRHDLDGLARPERRAWRAPARRSAPRTAPASRRGRGRMPSMKRQDVLLASRGRRRRSREAAAMSTSCSRAIRRTSGDDRCRRRSSAVTPRGRHRCRAERAPRRRRDAALPAGRSDAGTPAPRPGDGVAQAPRHGLAGLGDHGDDAVDGHRLALLRPDLGQHAGGRRRDLGVDLVGRDLEQRLVAIDRVADLLDPADDRCPRRSTRPSAASRRWSAWRPSGVFGRFSPASGQA